MDPLMIQTRVTCASRTELTDHLTNAAHKSLSPVPNVSHRCRLSFPDDAVTSNQRVLQADDEAVRRPDRYAKRWRKLAHVSGARRSGVTNERLFLENEKRGRGRFRRRRETGRTIAVHWTGTRRGHHPSLFHWKGLFQSVRTRFRNLGSIQ